MPARYAIVGELGWLKKNAVELGVNYDWPKSWEHLCGTRVRVVNYYEHDKSILVEWYPAEDNPAYLSHDRLYKHEYVGLDDV